MSTARLPRGWDARYSTTVEYLARLTNRGEVERVYEAVCRRQSEIAVPFGEYVLAFRCSFCQILVAVDAQRPVILQLALLIRELIDAETNMDTRLRILNHRVAVSVLDEDGHHTAVPASILDLAVLGGNKWVARKCAQMGVQQCLELLDTDFCGREGNVIDSMGAARLETAFAAGLPITTSATVGEGGALLPEISLVHMAIAGGHLSAAMALLDAGHTLDGVDGSCMVQWNHEQQSLTVSDRRLFVARRIGMDPRDLIFDPPLATRFECPNWASRLLDTLDGKSLLYVAVRTGKIDIAASLLYAGVEALNLAACDFDDPMEAQAFAPVAIELCVVAAKAARKLAMRGHRLLLERAFAGYRTLIPLCLELITEFACPLPHLPVLLDSVP